MEWVPWEGHAFSSPIMVQMEAGGKELRTSGEARIDPYNFLQGT